MASPETDNLIYEIFFSALRIRIRKGDNVQLPGPPPILLDYKPGSGPKETMIVEAQFPSEVIDIIINRTGLQIVAEWQVYNINGKQTPALIVDRLQKVRDSLEAKESTINQEIEVRRRKRMS